jgi:hypothetical protein
MRLRWAVPRAALVVFSASATILLLEALLRWSPFLLPYGLYFAVRFSSDLGLAVHAAPPVYNRLRWNRRAVNRDGFLDVEHAQHKTAGVRRVGFFGDSYVEAVQVRLEDTFFRRLPTQIAGQEVEALAFGISGWGTLHSLIAYRVMAPRYELDDVVYLFVMNDPGDNYYKVKHWGEVAAALDGAGFSVRKQRSKSATDRACRLFTGQLMLARIVCVRVKMRQVTAAQRHQAERGVPKPVDQNDYPSSWPPELLAETELLARRILLQFRDEVAHDGRSFAVLYVPRGDRELEGKLSPEDNWFPWLSRTCAELGIPLWDPRELLSRQHAAGRVIYDDHWSPAGHELIASFLAEQLRRTWTERGLLPNGGATKPAFRNRILLP